MAAFYGGRDHDSDDAPGMWSDALCFLLMLFNAAMWPTLAWLIFGP